MVDICGFRGARTEPDVLHVKQAEEIIRALPSPPSTYTDLAAVHAWRDTVNEMTAMADALLEANCLASAPARS